MNKKIIISFITLSLSFYLHSAVLIKGDKDAPEGQTFSFTVNKNIFSTTGNFYESTNEILTSNEEFTLSRLISGTRAFIPLMPKLVTLDDTPNAENPLFGDKIIALGMLETEDGFSMRDLPIVIGENRPAKIYLFENINQFNNTIIVSSGSGDVRDATGAVSPGVVALTTNNEAYVFAAVKPNDGEFGQEKSGIALLMRGFVKETTSKGETINNGFFRQIDANTGFPLNPQSLLLDATSPTLFIGNPLAHIVQNQAVMYWDNAVKRLYIGLQVTAHNGATDGARAIVACKFIQNGAITLEKIAPDSAFSPGNTTEIVGAIGAGQQISIHALSSMYTSTALSYLIVVGNNGTPATTTNSVFALPLVNTGDSQGMIASKNAQPVNVFRNANVPHFTARTISEPATTPDEMTHATDVAAQVGGGPLNSGPIINIIVRDDTVFAFVGENNPGVYSSQALFDASGKITSWTQWQRAAGTTNNTFGAALNAFEGDFILASGTTTDTVNTIKKTIWSDGAPESLQPLTAILDATLSANNGGVQGMQTFLPNTPGLHDIALLAAGGIGTVVLAQTGILNANNIITPTAGPDFNNKIEFDNGTITSDVNAATVIISGGALNNVGPITALEIGATTTNGWLFVGGSNGLAILAQEDGSGWDTATQLGNNLVGLTNGMMFKIIGNYSFVKKIISDSDFLYVITHDKVDRINLTTSNFGTNNLDVTTIISNNKRGLSAVALAKEEGFLDGIFSQALGIIATTDNLLRIGDNKDIRIVKNETDADWTIVEIAENAGPPTALYTVTTTNRAQDITKNQGGHFYALSADVGLNQSRINRFAVQPLGTTDTINSNTVQAFDDLFVKNIPSFLLSFGEFRSNFTTDGALYFATRNQNIMLPPIALLTPANLEPRVGVGNVGDRSAPVNINFQQGTEINYFARSQASGSWIAAGNFNTQVLE